MRAVLVIFIISCCYYVMHSLAYGVLEIFDFTYALDYLFASKIYSFVDTLMGVAFHSTLIILVYKNYKIENRETQVDE